MVYRRDFRRNVVKRQPGLLSRWSVTWTLIVINVVLFFLFLFATLFFDSSISFLSDWTNDSVKSTVLTDSLAVQPCHVLSGEKLWTIFTSMFMHAGFFHLFVNMFSLFFLGGLTERIIGRRRFFLFYLIAGLVGSLFFVFGAFGGQFFPHGSSLLGGIDSYAVGASGAIFGLLGVLAVLLPMKEIYLIVGPLIVLVLQVLIGKLPIASSVSGVIDVVASVLIFMMIFSVFSTNSFFRKLALPLRLKFWLAPVIAILPLLVIGFFVELPIGNSAHLGGLVAGLVYGGYLRSKYRQKVKLLNRMVR